jgi:hypothetical protein
MKSLEITFKPDGTYEIEANGFKGRGCEKATEFLEQALSAGKIKSRRKKPEYHSTVTTTQKQTA